jgi:hypothetical protein
MLTKLGQLGHVVYGSRYRVWPLTRALYITIVAQLIIAVRKKKK